MFYSLYKDRHVVYGGVWYDPVNEDFIEVIDVADAGRNHESVNYIERGSAYMTVERLETALRGAGYFTEEEPPKHPAGRKQWFVEDLIPPPKPGALFWMPEPILGPRILKSWEEWEAFKRAGSKFEEVPQEIRDDVLLAAEAVMSYHGIDGGHSGPIVVIKKADATPKLRREYPNAIISSNPEKAIWEILKKMGVRREVES